MARPSPQTDRVVTLIEALAADPDTHFTLAEVTRRLGVNKSSCHSMLAALLGAGWLVRDGSTRAYRLGPALLAIGRRAAAGFPAVDLARPAMVELARSSGAHCLALSIDGHHATVVDQVRDVRSPSWELPIGEITLRPPLGTVVYAWSDEAAVERWLAGESDRSRAHHRAVLDAVRRRGFSVELSTPPETRLRNLVARLREGLAAESTAGQREGRPGSAGGSIEEMVDRLVGELGRTEGAHDVLPLEIEDDREYFISSLSAPVFDSTGTVVLTLSLLGFPGLLPGTEVVATGRRVAAASAGVTRALGGTVPPTHPGGSQRGGIE